MFRIGEEPISGYRLEEFLGRGGFGSVWRASAPGGTSAALKLIDLQGAEGLKEFRGIQRVKEIRHPNLMPITALWMLDDQGQVLDDATIAKLAVAEVAASGSTEFDDRLGGLQPATLVVAMLLGEQNLQQRLVQCQEAGQAGISVGELLGCMEDAAKAIDFLNSLRHVVQGEKVAVQHGDIKPPNIMLLGGAALVCDFGLARLVGRRATQSIMSGSPSYMAPECFQGSTAARTSDQYSLAISYVELRTGRLPIEADIPLAVMHAHLQGDLNLSHLPPVEQQVIRRATALDPSKRFHNCAAMVAALGQAAATRQRTRSTPPPRPKASPSVNTAAVLSSHVQTRSSPKPVVPHARVKWKYLIANRRVLFAAAIGVCLLLIALLFVRPSGESTGESISSRKAKAPESEEHVGAKPLTDELPEYPHPIPPEPASANSEPITVNPESRQFVSNTNMLNSMNDDLSSYWVVDRQFQRYFTLTHLYNAGDSEEVIQAHRDALFCVLKAVAGDGDVTLHPADPPRNTIFRVDLRKLNWDEATWNQLIRASPYSLVPTSNAMTELQADTKSDLPFVRGDWFVVSTLRMYASLPPERDSVTEALKDMESNVPIEKVHEVYAADLDISRVAAESGVQPTELLAKATTEEPSDVAVLGNFKNPNSKVSRQGFLARARELAIALGAGTPTVSPAYDTNSIGVSLKLIPPGEFLMGATSAEIERILLENPEYKGSREWFERELPQHPVRITHPFYLGVFEVTQSEFESVMGSNPSEFSSDGESKDSVAELDTSRFPVESVTWYDAVEFCNKLSERERLSPYYTLAVVERTDGTITDARVTVAGGNGYRLPTEAEWEYACRAGTTTPFHFGSESNGKESNVDGSRPFGTTTKGPDLNRPAEVGSYRANAFGLYDMHGNVEEWCQDWSGADYYKESPREDPQGPPVGDSRVVRGGEWLLWASTSRSASRGSLSPSTLLTTTGFRLARTVPKESVPNDIEIPDRNELTSVSRVSEVSSSVETGVDNRRPKKKKGNTIKNSIDMKLVLIPEGEFMMGSPESELERGGDEHQHLVKITRPFYLGMHEVTQTEFVQVTGTIPSAFSSTGGGRRLVSGTDTDNYPVEMVSWYDAIEFCNKLSEREGLPAYYSLRNVKRRTDGTVNSAEVTIAGGKGYRLPTEAEWEYACRAGTTTAFHFGDVNDGQNANVNAESRPYGSTEKGRYLWSTWNVGNYPPNAFGLRDMHGNVWEWCEDWYDEGFYERSTPTNPVNHTEGLYRVVRGGSWHDYAKYSRAASRKPFAPIVRNGNVGFRVARTP